MKCTLVAALLLRVAFSGEGDKVEGEVALEHSPLCEFFVVLTERGASLLDWRGGHYVVTEGDPVIGPLYSRGVQTFQFDGQTMKAMVEGWGVERRIAREIFRSRCKLDVMAPEGAV